MFASSPPRNCRDEAATALAVLPRGSVKLGGRDRARGRREKGGVTVAEEFPFFFSYSKEGIKERDSFLRQFPRSRFTCTLQSVALLVRALVTIHVVVAQFGQFEELQHFRRLVHLAPEVTVLQVQEEHLSS